jgi:hypothetical protein
VRPKRLARVLAVAATVVAALTQATSLVDWAGSKLHRTPAATIDPRIVSIERQSPLSLRDYLRGVNEQPAKTTSDDQLDAKGLVFGVTMRIQGEQGSRFGLRWFIVDSHENRLPGPSFNQEPAIFSPRNQNQRREYPVWVPRPAAADTYTITFELVNAKGEPVDQRSEKFRVPA